MTGGTAQPSSTAHMNIELLFCCSETILPKHQKLNSRAQELDPVLMSRAPFSSMLICLRTGVMARRLAVGVGEWIGSSPGGKQGQPC
jgi:hypothetical protein